MRIAIPLAQGKLAMHFGHCEEFALMDVDEGRKVIVSQQRVKAPEHQPGLLPRWLGERGVNVVIAGGMGVRAQQLFATQGIRVAVGAAVQAPEDAALAFVAGTLKTGNNVCAH